MEENKFMRGLPEHIKAEFENAELNVRDANEIAKEAFPDNPRGQELVKKETLGDITKKEQIELNKLLDAKNKKDGKKKKKPEDLDNN